MLRFAIIAAAALLASQAVAGELAARLTGVKGEVLVWHEGRFVAATSAALAPGDRVVVRRGEAQVRFADGCVAVLKTGSMATVSGSSPCAGGNGVVTAGETSAQNTTETVPVATSQGITALQWAGLGLTAAVIAAGIAEAVDEVGISN